MMAGEENLMVSDWSKKPRWGELRGDEWGGVGFVGVAGRDVLPPGEGDRGYKARMRVRASCIVISSWGWPGMLLDQNGTLERSMSIAGWNIW